MTSFNDKIIEKFISKPEIIKHSINVFILVYEVLQHLPEGYISDKEKTHLLFAALFHDIGKINWKEEWFNKPKNLLKKEEWDIMLLHPLVSSLLIMQDLSIKTEALSMIEGHHERPETIGHTFNSEKPTKSSLILIACDIIAACTETRKYRKNSLTMHEAIKQIFFVPAEVKEAIYRSQLVNTKDKIV